MSVVFPRNHISICVNPKRPPQTLSNTNGTGLWFALDRFMCCSNVIYENARPIHREPWPCMWVVGATALGREAPNGVIIPVVLDIEEEMNTSMSILFATASAQAADRGRRLVSFYSEGEAVWSKSTVRQDGSERSKGFCCCLWRPVISAQQTRQGPTLNIDDGSVFNEPADIPSCTHEVKEFNEFSERQVGYMRNVPDQIAVAIIGFQRRKWQTPDIRPRDRSEIALNNDDVNYRRATEDSAFSSYVGKVGNQKCL
ncbi:hypothetical protein CBL_10723 [Carabus blaptoides fortunei]